MRFIKITTFIVFTSILFCGCSSLSDGKPENLIPRTKMIQILADVHITDAIVTNHQGIYREHKPLPEAYYKSIFKKHTITHEQFDSSVQYYMDGYMLKEMYADVTKIIETEKQKVSKKTNTNEEFLKE